LAEPRLYAAHPEASGDVTRPLPTYRDLAEPDRSGIPDQVGEQRVRVAARLAGVRHVVAVASGKGGVGKSYVAAKLAQRLAAAGRAVGLLDADLNGPTIPRLTQTAQPLNRSAADAIQPAVTADGVRVFSAEFLAAPGDPLRWREPEGDAFVWRGTLEAGAVREMLADVAWGRLDLLLVDLPPGPARLADLHGFVPGLRGVVAVTLPSDESLDAVRRSLLLARERGVPLLGMVENLVATVCPGCGGTHPTFVGEAGARLSAEFEIPLLARLPFHPSDGALDAMAASMWAAVEGA
jgi:ATP-binding protein involved in chromosome partitioning